MISKGLQENVFKHEGYNGMHQLNIQIPMRRHAYTLKTAKLYVIRTYQKSYIVFCHTTNVVLKYINIFGILHRIWQEIP